MTTPNMPVLAHDIDLDRDCRALGDADFGRLVRQLIAFWHTGNTPSDHLPKALRLNLEFLFEARTRYIKNGIWFQDHGSKNAVATRHKRMSKAGWMTPRIRGVIFNRDGWECVWCKSEDDLTVDHILPVSRGGKTVEDNLRCLCRSCNSRKGNRLDGEVAHV